MSLRWKPEQLALSDPEATPSLKMSFPVQVLIASMVPLQATESNSRVPLEQGTTGTVH